MTLIIEDASKNVSHLTSAHGQDLKLVEYFLPEEEEKPYI